MEKKAKSFDHHIVRIRVLSCVLVVLIHITHAYLYAGGKTADLCIDEAGL